ncbi:MAG: hypothetical protein CMH54_09825 [Myxococcales bacterium]|nr:hypothetical protein [Myxococcales bacterium]
MSTLWTHSRRFDCSQEELYRLLLSPEFDQILGKKLDLHTEILRQEDTAAGSKLTLEVRSNRKLPGFMRSLVGKHNGWYEVRQWKEELCGYEWEVRPLSEKIPVLATGVVRVDADSSGNAIRYAEGTFEAKIPLIGRKIEGYLVQRTNLAFDTSAEILVNLLQD